MREPGVMPWSMERESVVIRGGEMSRREEWRDREEGLGERRLPTWHHHDQCDYSWKWICPVQTGTLFSVLDFCDSVTVSV